MILSCSKTSVNCVSASLVHEPASFFFLSVGSCVTFSLSEVTAVFSRKLLDVFCAAKEFTTLLVV